MVSTAAIYSWYKNQGAGRGFELANLFDGGEVGGLYLTEPEYWWQDAAASVSWDEYGDPVGRNADSHAPEQFDTTYESDFSAGADGWVNQSNTVVEGNIDGIEGLDDWLRATAEAGGGSTVFRIPQPFTPGKNYRVVMRVYVPSDNSFIDGFKVYSAFSGIGLLLYDGVGQNGSIVNIDVTDYIKTTGTNPETLYIYGFEGASQSVDVGAAGDVIYTREVLIQESNLFHAIQEVSDSRPIGSRQPVTGIRALNTNNTMAGAVAGNPGTLPDNFELAGAGWQNSEVVDVGEVDGLPYIDLRIFGTPDSTSAIVIRLDDVIGSGDTWTQSVYTALIAGDLSNLSGVVLRNNNEVTPGTVINITPTLTRVSVTNDPAASDVRPTLRFNGFVTGDVDFTLRIAGVQSEKGLVATDWQRVVNPFDVTEAGVRSVNYLKTFDDSMTHPGTASAWKFMHNGDDGTAVMALSVNVPEDVDGLYRIMATRNNSPNIGWGMSMNDIGANDATAEAIISDGTNNYSARGSANSMLREVPQVWLSEAIVDNLSVAIDEDEKANFTFPSIPGDATGDMVVFAGLNGVNPTPCDCFGWMVIGRELSDVEKQQVNAAFRARMPNS